ncbi:hypothetical protein [uncultured Sphingomonas sp.]|uniref:hypothetical protein n=1 Tax=uncultured Sphingomonas sp. TaxID=158754 RepID=UPI0035CC8DBC
MTAGLALAVVLGDAAIAQQTAMTVQQQFEAAATATAGDDKVAALAWTALEQRVAKNPRSLAIVHIRESDVLLALDRKDEAAAAARAGLAVLAPSDASLAEDRFLAQSMLGRIAREALDYASAVEAYRAAEATAILPGDKLAAALGIANTDIFVDPAGAEAALGRIDALLASNKSDAVVRGQVMRAHGLLYLNQGRFREAQKASASAVELFGGLTEKSDLNDVAVRSDTAIAAMLAGDAETARKYMAYTGAGRIADGSFNPAVQMTPPDCGGEAGLKPADLAVVEFSIAEDGSVLQAAPIYAAGGGAVALEFARAATRWSWTPDEVKALPRFFRYRARVEMRCSTAFTRPSIRSAMNDAVIRWLVDKGAMVADAPDSSAVSVLPTQRARLAGAPAGRATIAASLPLLNNPIVPADEKHAIALRALAAADADGAPPLARLALDLDARESAKAEGRRAKGYAVDLRALLALRPYADDPRARAAIRVSMAAGGNPRHPDPQMRDWLRQVVDDPALEKTDPLKIAALLQIASIEQRAGDTAAAKVAFDQTGLTADQCALIDAPPAFLSVGGTFPTEAQRWGFEGWTLTQFDIAANGHVQGQRAIISYPPFIFTKAGEETIGGARYAKSYRPEGALGCGAATQRVKFKLPYRH